MFSIIDIFGNNEYFTQLARINHIFNASQKFTQLAYDSGKNNQRIEYLVMAKSTINGLWAYYDNSKEHYVQTDVFTGPNGNPVILNYDEVISNIEKTFDITDDNGNKDLIMYPNIISPENIYLFKVKSTGMYE